MDYTTESSVNAYKHLTGIDIDKPNISMNDDDNEKVYEDYEKQTAINSNSQFSNIPFDYNTYSSKADRMLQRFAGKHCLTGKILADAAQSVFKRTGKHIPIEFVISQAQIEGGLTGQGRSTCNNPFNVGEFDNGTMMRFSSPQQGVNAYYNLLAKDYLRGNKTTNDLLNNYVNHNGSRYASAKNYEQQLKKQVDYYQRNYA